LSQEKEKITIPGRKNVYRLFNEAGHAILDLMALATAEAPAVDAKILVHHPSDDQKRAYVTPARVECMHQLFFDGRLVQPIPDVHDGKRVVEEQLSQIRPDVVRYMNPTPYKLCVTTEL
jgi:nicotinate phosphoribosyltransferase